MSAGSAVAAQPVRVVPRSPRGTTTPAIVGVAMITPTVLVFAGFVAIPIVAVVLTSFTRWTGFDIAGISWIGIDNYAGLLDDPIFLRALLHTLVFTVATTILLNAAGFGLAL